VDPANSATCTASCLPGQSAASRVSAAEDKHPAHLHVLALPVITRKEKPMAARKKKDDEPEELPEHVKP
jgi:hypothetical protein